MTECKICGGPHRARRLCNKHWQQWRKTADPQSVRQRAYPSLQAAFDAVNKWTTEDGCLIWQGSHTGYEPRLYGKLTFHNNVIGAHCAAYELRYGAVPAGFEVDHRCRTTLCVNADHLRIVTRKQNQEHRAGSNSNSLTGIRGITYDRGRGKYRARLKHNNREIHVGRFDTIEEAEAAVIGKRNELFSHNSCDRVAIAS